MTRLIWAALAFVMAGALALGSAFADGHGTMENCGAGIDQVMAALEGDIEDMNARTEAESELDEALEAQGEEDWEDCVDALEEALEALDMELVMADG